MTDNTEQQAVGGEEQTIFAAEIIDLVARLDQLSSQVQKCRVVAEFADKHHTDGIRAGRKDSVPKSEVSRHYIAKEAVAAALPEYMAACLNYPDGGGTRCNQCFNCKVRNNDDFQKGFEHAIETARLALNLDSGIEGKQ